MVTKVPFLVSVLAALMVMGMVVTTSVGAWSTLSADQQWVGQEDATPRPTIEPFLQDSLQIISGNVQRPNGIFWFEDYLYTGCAGDFTLYKIHDTTGVTSTYIAGIQNTHTMYIESGESGPILWVADFQRNAISRIDLENSPARVDIATELGSPWGIAHASDDTFFVAQLRTDDLINITRDGQIRQVAAGLRNPTGVVVDADNFVYVANNGSARRAIEWLEYDSTAAPLQEADMQPLVSGLQNTTNIIMGPDNLLYIAYSLGTRGIVGRVDPVQCREQGGCTNVDVEIVLWSELAAPLAGLAISPDMRLFVHTMFGSEIYWVQLPTDTLAEES